MAKKTIKRADFVPKKSTDIAQAQTFLKLFGYLGTPDHPFEGLTHAPEPENFALEAAAVVPGEMTVGTEEALKKYQVFHGLNATGKLDEATIAAMNAKRCGMPDLNATPGLASFVAQGNKWASNDITYGFENFSPDLTPAATGQAIAQAFAMWAAETRLRFRQIPIASNPNIRIRFVAGDHGDGSPFDGGSGVLAHAFYPPPNGGDIAGDAHFDEAETWTITVPPGSGHVDLVTVAAHEFGHSLGLNHSSVANSLMFPSYSGPHRFLHSDDVAGIQSIYGGYAIDYASWIHGTSIEVEWPNQLESITRAGFYTYLVGKPGTTNWFHFAVPTPVILDSVRLKIICAILRFRTMSANAVVRDVHIYDGFSKIAAHDGINLSGDQWFVKFGVAHKPEVFWGLGISIGVQFVGGTSAQRRMDFVSAGFDLFK
jgi:Matrixin/Putative peptidoglycan binding domain